MWRVLKRVTQQLFGNSVSLTINRGLQGMDGELVWLLYQRQEVIYGKHNMIIAIEEYEKDLAWKYKE
jgi:hypothetical protein